MSKLKVGDICVFNTKESDLATFNNCKCRIVRFSDEEDVGPIYEVEFIDSPVSAFEYELTPIKDEK